MPGPGAPYTQLDADQVLRQAFDESTDSLRVKTEATVVAGAMEVAISHVDDSIKIGDGTTLAGVTVSNELKTSDSASRTSLASIDTKVATAALQTTSNTKLDTINTTLTTIDAGIPTALGQTTMANSMPVVLPSNQVIDTVRLSSATNRYSAIISIRQDAATTAGEVIWSMRNSASATRDVYIDEIELQLSFDSATPLTRSIQRYNIQRFSSATPTGGSSITPCKFDVAGSATNVTDIRSLNTGLTTTGIVLENILANPGIPCTEGSTSSVSLTNLGLKLIAGEGLLISLTDTAIIGQSISGVIVWSER